MRSIVQTNVFVEQIASDNKLFKHYHGSDVRVIAMNMPDFTHTRQHGFWHSTAERTSFIRDFLAKLNVQQIDCLVSHSAGFLTASALWGEPNQIVVKSAALFSPQTLWIEYNPRLDKMPKVFIGRNEFWYKLFELSQIYRIPYWPMKFTTANEFLTFAAHFIDKSAPSDHYPRVDYLLKQTNIPVSILGGANDEVIAPLSNAELHQKLGIEMKDVIMIDPKIEPADVVMAKSNKRMNSYVIRKGGHFTHNRYSLYANRMVDNLLTL